MGKVIAVMKQHGFHEPALPKKDTIDESSPVVVEARALGIDVDTFAKHSQGAGYLTTSLKAEIKAMKEARRVKDWWEFKFEDHSVRQRVRAILAEKKSNDLCHEISMLKQRLKQADNGKGDWVDERDALLTEIDSLRRKAEEPRAEEESVVTQSLRAQVNVLEQALEKAKREYEETSKAIANENTELHGKLAEWEELLEERKQAIANWEVRFQEEHQAYQATLKEHDALKARISDYNADINQDYEVITRLQNELAGYKAANKRLVEANEKLQDELDRADSAGLREAPADEVAWLRSRVEYLEGKLR